MYFDKKFIPYTPFLIFFILLIIFHLSINLSLDDFYFKSFFNSLFYFNENNFIIFRFNEWSWRFIIESLLTVLCTFPIVWIISDSALFVLLAYLVPKFLIKNYNKLNDKDKLKYNIIGILLTIVFIFSNFNALESAGFIATTLNYTWPFILAVLHLYIFKEYFYNEKKIEKFKKIILGIICIMSLIFAINMEIVLISVLIIYIIFILYNALMVGKNNFFSNLFEFLKSNKFLLLILLIILVMFIIFILCPGNKSRFLQETSRLDIYRNITIFNKIDLSLTTIYCMLLTTIDFSVFLFLFVLMIFSSKLTNNMFFKLIIALPVIFFAILYSIKFISPSLNEFLFGFILEAFQPYGLFSHKIILRSVVISLSYLILILDISLSLNLIYKYNQKLSLIILFLLIIAFISQMVIGFSPSCLIWSYPFSSYPGRWWIIFNGIQIFTTAILIYELMKNNDKYLKC